MTKTYINYLAKLNYACHIVINTAHSIRTSKIGEIDAHIQNIDKLASAIADVKRALLYFKNTGQAPVPPSTPPKPPKLYPIS